MSEQSRKSELYDIARLTAAKVVNSVRNGATRDEATANYWKILQPLIKPNSADAAMVGAALDAAFAVDARNQFLEQEAERLSKPAVPPSPADSHKTRSQPMGNHEKKKDSPSAATLRESWVNLTKATSNFAAALKDRVKQAHANWTARRLAEKSIRLSKAVIRGSNESQRRSEESIRLSNYVFETLKQKPKG
ncbi:hypothetical protein [Corynebacterium sp.]|uniref:hypothetical protein n=1 Tax=Corynebacterium sp. TaxID=1720 RepID=UPI0028AA94E1|nr:hypothetical protein [Corynebacterium sp.]